MRPLLVAALALSLVSLACAPVRVDYTPVETIPQRAPIDPEDVEVYPQDGPDWDHVHAGDFQEASRDSVPGGRAGLVLLLRQLGAEEGCDGVIVGGNVSRFSGAYVSVGRRSRRRSSDGSSASLAPRPVFERFGVHAQCLARTDPLWPLPNRIRRAPATPDEFFSF